MVHKCLNLKFTGKIYKHADILKYWHTDILKCEKDTDSVDSGILKTKMVEQFCYQNVLCVVVKTQDLQKNKNQKDY